MNATVTSQSKLILTSPVLSCTTHKANPMIDANLPTMPEALLYDPASPLDYQMLDSGTILKLRFPQLDRDICLETHREVWAPSRFTIGMGDLIQAIDCKDKVVLDFAGGSGILGIIAGMQGARRVIITDLNPQAIITSKQNWGFNHLDPSTLQVLLSDRFAALDAMPHLKGQIDRIYSNPPTFPGTADDLRRLLEPNHHDTAANWNRNGERGRLVTDALITQGQDWLAPDGEILFVTTSKQGSRQTRQLMEQYWGAGIAANQADPLDSVTPWEERGSATWAVVRRIDLQLADYYWEFLPLYRQMAEHDGEPDPILERDGKLYQKLYFIRAKKME